MRNRFVLLGAALTTLLTASALANPYPDPTAVPRDPPGLYPVGEFLPSLDLEQLREDGVDVLRVQVDWAEGESFSVASAVIERSGTQALVARSAVQDPHGSYQGSLVDASGKTVAYASVGTGMEFRKLARAMTFRFPRPKGAVEFRLEAENPDTGAREEVLKEALHPTRAPERDDLEVRLVREAPEKPSLALNLYAEGYTEARKDRFFEAAEKVAQALDKGDYPGSGHFEIRAVFAPSNVAIGKATDLGLPVAERDSFLGLYFPYWDNFGRWYHVVYPTREARYRAALGQVPYDYPMALVDDSEYWGVGNFGELTAIPAGNGSFTYLLLHEFGHFFGLNEEYESGGKTELAFSPGIDEPWSQNITFLRDPSDLKWKAITDAVYPGGYAQTPPLGMSHKPAHGCTMESGTHFCSVCRAAVEARVKRDLGG